MLVMKFGGASLKGPESFQRLAKIIIERSEERIVVVVSAMANMTDQLFDLARKVNPSAPKREQDMLVSVGERISIALLAMALAREGREAVSFTGSQSGIITCESHSEASIVEVRPRRLQEALCLGKVAIVAGFQGMSRKGEITTLGRGGSDTSAVALAVAMGARQVDFYKDVPGVFDVDPKKDPRAKMFSEMSFPDALRLAKEGAKILQPRAIALAEKNGVRLIIRSMENPKEIGTLIGAGCERSACLSYEELACSHN